MLIRTAPARPLTAAQRRILANLAWYAGLAVLLAAVALAVWVGSALGAGLAAAGAALWVAGPVAVELWKAAGEEED